MALTPSPGLQPERKSFFKHIKSRFSNLNSPKNTKKFDLRHLILHPPNLQKCANFRTKLNKVLDYCEFCKISLIDLFSNKIMVRKFTKSFKTMYLFDLMKSGYIQKVSSILTSNKLIKFDINEQGKNLVHIAAIRSTGEIIQQLLKFRFDVNKKDSKERSPLYYALKRKNRGVILELMRARCDLNDACLPKVTDVIMENLNLFNVYKYVKKVSEFIKMCFLLIFSVIF